MKKVLVVFTEGSKKSILIDSAVFLKEKQGYEIIPLYIRDVRRDEIIPATMDGMIVNLSNNSFLEERDAMQQEDLDELKKQLQTKGINNTMNVEFGFPDEIIKDYLKLSDLLLFEKGESLSDLAVTLLKHPFKPMIMLGDKAITSFDKVAISSDDGVKVNKSTFAFLNAFPSVNKILLYSILHDSEKNNILEYLTGKNKSVEYKNFVGDEGNVESFLEEVNKLDLLIMGNLKKAYFFEKLIGKKGLEIMEKSKTAIFIV